MLAVSSYIIPKHLILACVRYMSLDQMDILCDPADSHFTNVTLQINLTFVYIC